MDVLYIRIEQISVPPRLRAVDAKAVERLSASIKDIGLRQPISVRLARNGVSEDGEVIENMPMLVAGRHRLEALSQLGHSHAPCVEVSDDEVLAQLWEIDENLIRAELSAAQRAQHLAKRKELWEVLNKGGKSVPTPGGEQTVGFASDTAEATGITKRSINQNLARAEAIGDDLTTISGTSLDKGVELDALTKLDANTRAELIQRAAAGESVSARDLSEFAASESRGEKLEWSALKSAWNKARPAVRRRLIEETCGAPGEIR